mgnify:CR=1 FL=1
MFEKKKNNYTRKDVKKAIKKIIKKTPIEKGDNRIEKIYLRKKAIKEYYEKNQQHIDDNTLVEIYNKIYNPDILVELAVGIFSGLASNLIGVLLTTQIPYNGDTGKDFIRYILFVAIVVLIAFIAFFCALIYSYKKILSLRSYNDKVDKYHREIVYQYIKKREENIEKKYKNEHKSTSKKKKR